MLREHVPMGMLQRLLPSCELTDRMVHSFFYGQHALRHCIEVQNRLRMILQLKVLKTAVNISWNNSQTRMLIAHFKDNPILWDKHLKDSANRQNTKKAMAPLLASTK